MNTDYSLIGGIIGIIALITFFVMAWRLGNLTKYVQQIGGRILNQPFYDAQTAEISSKTQEAIQKYIEVLYLVTNVGYTIPKHTKGKSTVFLVEKIKGLGGTIPDRIMEMNEFIK